MAVGARSCFVRCGRLTILNIDEEEVNDVDFEASKLYRRRRFSIGSYVCRSIYRDRSEQVSRR